MSVYPLRPFPRRLLRSLLGFAGAGTLMAGLVWADGAAGPAVPAVMAFGAWLVPAMFAWQIARQGFDPLASLAITDDGLLATGRDGAKRLLPWRGMARLVRVEGFRQRGFEVHHADGLPLRWFGELADEDGFVAALAVRSGLTWEWAAGPEDEPREPGAQR